MKGTIFGPNWRNTLFEEKLNFFKFWTVLKPIFRFLSIEWKPGIFVYALGGLPHCNWLWHRRSGLDQCGRNTCTVSCRRTTRLEKKTSRTRSARPNGRESIFAIEEVALYACGKHCFEWKYSERVTTGVVAQNGWEEEKWAFALLLHPLPPNIHIIPDTNGWMDLKIFKQYLNLLRDALAPLHPPKVVLVMDCHPSHYSWKTLSLLRRWKWKVLLIPSKLTGLLQPLDAWVFAAFKKQLHVAAMHTNIRRDNTEHDLSLWLGNVLSTITSSFTQTSSKAHFEKCGLTARKERIRPSVLTHIKAELLGIIRTLTVDELTFYIGKNADALRKLLFTTAVPEEFQHAHVHNFLPHQRMSSKRSLHPE